MYVPKHFSESEQTLVNQLISQNGFVNVLSFPKDEMPFINHLPVIFSGEPSEDHVLIGHMAVRNPQWTHFEANPKCMIIVNGPHAYITPTWYQSGRDVPTWNYAVAHLYGQIELIKDFKQQVKVLERLTDFYEKSNVKPWEFELPEDLLDPESLTSAIISFKFRIEKVDAKFKLSQNRPDIDRKGVMAGLAQKKDDLSKAILNLMIEAEKKR